MEEESALVNDPLFSKQGVKFFCRRSETNPGDRKDKNFKKGKHRVNSCPTGMSEKENKKKATVVTFVKERINWMNVRKLSRKNKSYLHSVTDLRVAIFLACTTFLL